MNEKTEVTIRHADLMGMFCILSGSINQNNEVNRGESSKTRICL